jgi:hypothetical protein
MEKDGGSGIDQGQGGSSLTVNCEASTVDYGNGELRTADRES